MQITFTFDSLEEMQKAVIDMAGQFSGTAIRQKPADPNATTQRAVDIINRADKKEAERKAAKADYPDPDPAEPEADPAPAPAEEKKPAPAAVDESYRVEVRKALAALNKKVPGNPAKELIQKHCGVDKLSDAPLDTLQGLMEAAMEALQSA